MNRYHALEIIAVLWLIAAFLGHYAGIDFLVVGAALGAFGAAIRLLFSKDTGG